jgi:hypothetical protein
MLSKTDNMRKKIVFEPQQLLTWSLVTFGLCITLWQSFNCTLQYLAEPVRVEEQFVNIDTLPPIQLSICKKISINPRDKVLAINFNFETYVEPETRLPSMLTYSRETFWANLSADGEYFQLGQLVKMIEFWNDTSSRWDVLFKDPFGGNLFDMAIHPYVDNDTLLCHTLRPGLAEFGTKFRLASSAKIGTVCKHYNWYLIICENGQCHEILTTCVFC